MNQYELVSVIQGQGELFVGTVSVFMSTLFAYVVTAYFIGARLTRAQAGLITSLFTLFSLLLLQVLYTNIRRLAEFSNDLAQLDPDAYLPFGNVPPEIAPIAMLLVFFGAFAAGLLFMFQLRRAANSEQPRANA